MIVNCEGCETGFQVDERLLKPGGSKVRCSKCRHVFVVYPPPPPVDDTEDPIVLSDEMAAVGNNDPQDTDMASIAAKLDELFDDTPATRPGPTAEESEMLDVGDLLTEDSAAPADTSAERGELDFDLDLGVDAGGAGTVETAAIESQPPAAGAPAEEEIDFNMELAPAGQPAEAAEDLPDLNELEIDLSTLEADVDDAAAAPKAEAGPEGAAGQDLELNFDFEGPALDDAAAEMGGPADAAGQKAAVPSSEELSLDLINELHLDLESAPEATTTTLSKNAQRANPLGKTDQIDLDDLENLLDDLEPAAGQTAGDAGEELVSEIQIEPVSDEVPDLDLSFLTDAGTDTPVPPPAAEAAKPEPVAAAAPREMGNSDELDFSDLSNILEDEHSQAEKAQEIQDIDLVLDDAALAGEAGVAPQESMLDIEALLAGDTGTAAVATTGTGEAPKQKPVATTDLEIEFDPLEDTRGAGRAAKATTAIGAAAIAAVGAADVSTQESSLAGGRDATDVLKLEPEEEPAPKKKSVAAMPRRHRGGVLKALMAIVVVVVLALAALVVPRTLGLQIPYLTDTEIPVLSEIDLELPYLGHVGKLFKAVVADPAGRLKILPDAASVSAEYVDNAVAGRLLVVKGRVRNAYDHPRSAIRVTATIFNKSGAAVKSATVYAGNILTGDELAAMDMNAIQSRLSFSASNANRQPVAKPGTSLPFMAVFGNLPAAIEEYSVEVAGSKP